MKFTIELTDAEWEKLKALAASRTEQTRGKTQYTPESCIRGFINTCVTDGGGGWVSPSEAASAFQAKKRAEAEAKAAGADVVPSPVE